MKLTFLGHACFKLEAENFSIVFDPYSDGSVPGLKNVREKASAVFMSHGHRDHNACGNIEIKAGTADNAFTVRKIASYHDDANGTLRGENIIHIVEGSGIKVIHFGDLGHIPEEHMLSELTGADVCLIPVGGHYTIDAKTAKAITDIIKPGLIIPMHFRGAGFGYDVISEVSQFTGLFEKAEYSEESAAEIIKTGETGRVLVLRPFNLDNR